MLDVEEGSPRLVMPRKTFHETGIAILAGVRAAYIGIYRVTGYGQVRFCEYGFYPYIAYLYFVHISLQDC